MSRETKNFPYNCTSIQGFKSYRKEASQLSHEIGHPTSYPVSMAILIEHPGTCLELIYIYIIFKKKLISKFYYSIYCLNIFNLQKKSIYDKLALYKTKTTMHHVLPSYWRSFLDQEGSLIIDATQVLDKAKMMNFHEKVAAFTTLSLVTCK